MMKPNKNSEIIIVNNSNYNLELLNAKITKFSGVVTQVVFSCTCKQRCKKQKHNDKQEDLRNTSLIN